MEELKKLTVSTNPHIRDENSVNKIMWNVVLALVPAVIAGVYFFKIKALVVILVSVIAAVLTEIAIQKLRKQKITVKDGSAVLTGLLLALVLSPIVPWWIPFIGSIFAIAIGKQIFGGLGHNIFNPALAGRAFLVISWPAIMTTWLLVDGTTGATPLGLLKLGGVNTGYLQLFLGNIGGCVGETSAIALLIGAAFLFYKKIIDWRIPAAYLGTVLIIALIFGKDPMFHLLAGGLLIGAFFMATDYVTSPITKNGKLIFGFGCGLITMILRLFSGYPEGVMFSILLMNAANPLIERFTRPMPFGSKKINKKKEAEKKEEKKDEKPKGPEVGLLDEKGNKKKLEVYGQKGEPIKKEEIIKPK
ncbi:MAG: RnfABCDGE type electron transport complex subunit D [Nanoarchaeota archaeon]|nr:RnfABCDGE type electron transport complex subunit D [Nanoarchaeota archaeon]